jgi:hypothetical protein
VTDSLSDADIKNITRDLIYTAGAQHFKAAEGVYIVK